MGSQWGNKDETQITNKAIHSKFSEPVPQLNYEWPRPPEGRQYKPLKYKQREGWPYFSGPAEGSLFWRAGQAVAKIGPTFPALFYYFH